MTDKTFRDKFNTPIPKHKRVEYGMWLQKESERQDRDILMDKEDYDIQGYFLSSRGKDVRGHGPDTFKKPNHPTFSTQSQYHGKQGYIGGIWSEMEKAYYPSSTNLRFWPKKRLEQYFKEVEPGVQLK